MSEFKSKDKTILIRLNELNQMVSLAQQELNQDINSADLEKLCEEDPTLKR